MQIIHRILGSLLSILFLVWFLSGLVMIYHTFPRVTPEDRLSKMDYLPADSLPSLADVTSRLPEGEKVQKVTLNRYLGQTIFHIRTDKDTYHLPADTAQTLPVIDGERIRQVASLWNQAPVERIDSLYTLDQWIPFGRLKEEFPIYKFHFNDPEKHQLYISSLTGEVLQFTDRKSRFWAWAGAIPHWIYFTSLRQDSERWIDVVVWLSGIGCVMCVAGIYLGIRDFRLARIRQKGLSPFKKFWYRWHHITGTVFGLFVLTFAFSGMMSLARVQDWGIRPKLDMNPNQELSKLAPTPAAYPLDYREVTAAYPSAIRQLEWSAFGSIPYYVVQTDQPDSSITVDASSDRLTLLDIDKNRLLAIIKKIHGEEAPIRISLLTSFDTYYVSRKHQLPLPVWKAEIADVDHSCYYVNPTGGQYRYVNTPARWMHWMYPALHSFNVKFLAEHPFLWNIAMWGLMLGGTIVSLTGVWLGTKYLIRKIISFSHVHTHSRTHNRTRTHNHTLYKNDESHSR